MKPLDQTIKSVNGQNIHLLLDRPSGRHQISDRRAQIAYLFAIISPQALGILLIFGAAVGFTLVQMLFWAMRLIS